MVATTHRSTLDQWLEVTVRQPAESKRELAVRLGVSLDVLKKVRRGHVPLVKTVRQMVAAGGADPATAEALVALARNRRHERSIRKGAQAKCRGECGRWEPAYKVRSRHTFRPATSMAPASFMHRSCAGQPAKVTLVCPKSLSVRRVYWSKSRKADHRDQRRSDGSYAVLREDHNRTRQGQRQSERMRMEQFRRFERRFEKSQYAKKNRTALVVWEHAQNKFPEAKRIVDELMGWGHFAKRRAAHSSRARARRPSRDRLFKRWAKTASSTPSRRSGFQLCHLCWKFVHGRRRYHTMCWATWRSSPEYREQLRQRRSSPPEGARGHIDPPVTRFVIRFRGPVPSSEKITQKFGWLALTLSGGTTQKQIAGDSHVTQPAVAIGIADFKRWLPGEWGLAFRHKETVQDLDRRFPLVSLRDHRGPHDELRVRWLARWQMGVESISRLLGYSIGQVRAILERPVTLDGGKVIARVVVPTDTNGSWRTEVLTASGWEPADLTVREVLLEGQAASRAALRAHEAWTGAAWVEGAPASVGGRAPHTAQPLKLHVAGLVVDRGRPHIVTGGMPARPTKAPVLSEREFALLEYLSTRAGVVIGHTQLAAAVWPRDYGSPVDLLKVYVSRLRRKLGDDIIQTIHGVGYSLGPPKLDPPERTELVRALADAGGNLAQAAARLGVPRSTLHYRLQKYREPSTA